MRKIWLVYDSEKDLPDELRIFENEAAAKDYEKALKKAGIKDPLVVLERIEKAGKIEYEPLEPDDKPDQKKPEKKEKPKQEKPSKIDIKNLFNLEDPPIPPDEPEKNPEECPDDNHIDNTIDNMGEIPEQSPEEINRDKLNDRSAKLPLFIKNPRVIDMVGRENDDLVDWEALDHDIKMGKNTYRANHIMNDLRMFDLA